MKTILPRHMVGIATFLFLIAVGYTSDANAQTRIPPPQCVPLTSACTKVVTFYNNGPDPIYPVIQAGIQSPDPWLQALFNNDNNTFAETHLTRLYIDPANGIPAGGSVSVSVPWYSALTADPDKYVDWWNGGRIIIFDNKAALTQVYQRDLAHLLSTTDTSPAFSCAACEPRTLAIYSDTEAYPSDIPFQLLEYTFADVITPERAIPYIVDLNVGYNISYLDQVYLPVALAPCLSQPCNPAVPDPSAVGYLGTTKTVSVFRPLLTQFANARGWPRYLDPLSDPTRPRLPGAYNLFTDALSLATNPLTKSLFTPASNQSTALKNMVAQWSLCTTTQNKNNCPQFAYYQDVAAFFKANFDNYLTLKCNGATYPTPSTLTGSTGQLYLEQYVYGWVAFNSGCGPAANALNPFAPRPWPPFNTAISEYIQLQYNFGTVSEAAQLFNPFTELVHSTKYLAANSYAFSVDDAAGFQSHPGQGLIVAMGGAYGLPNDTPVVLPADFSKDFEIDLGDTIAQNRPLWKSYGICRNSVDTNFPPLPPNAKNGSRTIIVDTLLNNISASNPCLITVTDANNKMYQIQAMKKVPWPPFVSIENRHHDTTVVSCPNGAGIVPANSWCDLINELSVPAEPRFALLTPPSQP